MSNEQSAIRDPQSAIRNPQSAIRNPQSELGIEHLLFVIKSKSSIANDELTPALSTAVAPQSSWRGRARPLAPAPAALDAVAGRSRDRPVRDRRNGPSLGHRGGRGS